MRGRKPVDCYCISPEYTINPNPKYFRLEHRKTTFQPHVYKLAEFIAKRADARYIIDLGAGDGQKLTPFIDRFNILAVDHGENLLTLLKISGVEGIDWDLERGLPPLESAVLQKAIVIAADVVEHLREPDRFFKALSLWAKQVPYLLISTPDRTRVRGPGNLGPPGDDAHARE